MDNVHAADRSEARIKDNLLQNVSTAIKQLQAQCCNVNDGEKAKDFTGSMWPVQELCHHLDCTLSHGLKISVGGYWTFVRQLTHKSTVQLIVAGLPRAVSNVMRGWAWLYIALNDRAVESYLKAVMDQPTLVNKHYLPHALLRDSQRLEILITVSSGLEHLSFALEPDTADLASWKSSVGGLLSTDANDEDQTDSAEEADVAQLGSCSVHDLNDPEDGHEEVTFDDDYDYDYDDPEVGAVSIVTFDPVSGLPLEDIVHSSTRATRRCKKEKSINKSLLTVVSPDPQPSQQSRKSIVDEVVCRESLLDFILESDVDFGETDVVTNVVKLRHKSSPSSTAKRVSFDLDNMVSVLGEEEECDVRRLSMSEREGPEGQEDPAMTASLSSLPQNVDDVDIVTKSPTSRQQQQQQQQRRRSRKSRPSKSWTRPMSVDAELMKFASDQLRDEIEAEVRQAKRDDTVKGQVPLNNDLHLMLMLDVVDDQDETVYKVFALTTGHTEGAPLHSYFVLTNNNFYLTRNDPVTGRYSVDASVRYAHVEFLQLSINYQAVHLVCVQPRRRYWLCTGNEEVTRNLVSSLEVAFRRCPQVSRLPCVFTDTTVQSLALSKWIADETALKASDVTIDHYSLVTWEDPHVLVLEKLAEDPVGPSREGHLMYRYTGTSAAAAAALVTSPWRPGYFRLKAGVFYQFNEPDDRMFKSYVQLLGGNGNGNGNGVGGCTGCRRVQSDDRPHAFELILTGDRSLRLAAPNDVDASEWLQVLLQSVSLGNDEEQVDESQLPTSRSSCVSACLVQAAQTLFVCHELLDTHSIRCLGKAPVQDVGAVQIGRGDDPSCCILEFESVDAMDSCGGDWALHFSDRVEMEKFLACLRAAWQDLYRIPLPCSTCAEDIDI